MDDMKLLEEMSESVAAFEARALSVAELADRLLALRDNLRFNDAEWYRELTLHLGTLDSASTFAPTTPTESMQLRHAIDTAIEAISKLIRKKAIVRE